MLYGIVLKNPYLPQVTYQTSLDGSCSVSDLKDEVTRTYPGSPSMSSQRMIYGGRLLTNAEKLQDILKDTVPGEVATFHFTFKGDLDASPPPSAYNSQISSPAVSAVQAPKAKKELFTSSPIYAPTTRVRDAPSVASSYVSQLPSPFDIHPSHPEQATHPFLHHDVHASSYYPYSSAALPTSHPYAYLDPNVYLASSYYQHPLQQQQVQQPIPLPHQPHPYNYSNDQIPYVTYYDHHTQLYTSYCCHAGYLLRHHPEYAAQCFPDQLGDPPPPFPPSSFSSSSSSAADDAVLDDYFDTISEAVAHLAMEYPACPSSSSSPPSSSSSSFYAQTSFATHLQQNHDQQGAENDLRGGEAAHAAGDEREGRVAAAVPGPVGMQWRQRIAFWNLGLLAKLMLLLTLFSGSERNSRSALIALLALCYYLFRIFTTWRLTRRLLAEPEAAAAAAAAARRADEFDDEFPPEAPGNAANANGANPQADNEGAAAEPGEEALPPVYPSGMVYYSERFIVGLFASLVPSWPIPAPTPLPAVRTVAPADVDMGAQEDDDVLGNDEGGDADVNYEGLGGGEEEEEEEEDENGFLVVDGLRQRRVN